MGRTTLLVVFFAAVIGSTFPAGAAPEGELAILTYPIGLVVGEQPIEVDLGPSGEPAELYLDGEPMCSLTAAKPRCTVDMGAAPHVHLLELFRFDSSGRVVAMVSRWVNRPGQEAELAIRLTPRSEGGICGGSALWSHPLKKDPVLLEVKQDGLNLRIGGDGRSFRFPCPDPDVPHVLTASAIFPDGRRAEAVALSGGFGGHTEAGLVAVPLVADGEGPSACEVLQSAPGSAVEGSDEGGFEVVFVLDPNAGYRTLMASGWTKGMMPTTTNSTKQFDNLVQQGSKGSDARAKNSWKKAESALIEADKLWFVLPDENLQRANGFGQGKMNWLPMLFNFGSVKLHEKPRIADAVAASGLVAAAGPRKRAVVVILGNKADRDGSGFSAEEARTYLAEVGVPLYVLRNGKLRDDGWPSGVPVRNMEAMADALETVKTDLAEQCIAWFPGQMHPNQIASALPAGIDIAGRRGEAPENVETIWRQAAVAEMAAETASPTEAAGEGRVEVTAVTVLVMARNAQGEPVTDLEIGDLEVAEDGRPVPVLGLEAATRGSAAVAAENQEVEAPDTNPSIAAPSMPVAVYVDRKLSGSQEIFPALEALAERSEWLASLGPVDVVVADQEVKTIISGTRDASELRSVLEKLAGQPSGQHAIERIRTRFIRDIRKIPNRLQPDDNDPELVGAEPGPMATLQAGGTLDYLDRSKALSAARSSIFEEDGVLRLAAERVNDWALSAPVARPRLLLVVGAGFDEDPVEFYLPFVERLEVQNVGRAREEFRHFQQSERVNEVGRELAAAGWMVVPVASRVTGTLTMSADTGGGDRFQAFLSASPDALQAKTPDWLLVDPLGSQIHLAAPSGGEVAMGGEGLDRLISESAGWYRLSYQIDRAPDGGQHELTITCSRPDASIRSAGVISSETSEGQAAVRVRRQFRRAGEQGELPVDLSVADSQPAAGDRVMADVTLTVDLGPIAPLLEEGRDRMLRVSVGVRADEAEDFVIHRLEMLTGTPTGWRYMMPLQWPAGPAELAVVVEDLASGFWGGAVQALP